MKEPVNEFHYLFFGRNTCLITAWKEVHKQPAKEILQNTGKLEDDKFVDSNITVSRHK